MEYRVLWQEGNLSLEQIINAYAREGWQVQTSAYDGRGVTVIMYRPIANR